MLCYRFLKHNVQRAMWLVDIAIAIERAAAEEGQSWFRSLGKVQRSWIETTFSIAHEVLGADVSHLPVDSSQGGNVPTWILQELYGEWHRPSRILPSISPSSLLRN